MQAPLSLHSVSIMSLPGGQGRGWAFGNTWLREKEVNESGGRDQVADQPGNTGLEPFPSRSLLG